MGDKMWLWVGAGWQGTSGSGFEQAAKEEKQWTTEDRWRRAVAEGGHATFSDSECHLVLFLSLSPFFYPGYPSVPVAAHWYTDSIFPPLSTSAISLISLCCSGSLSFNRHNKAALGFFLHSIPAVHPSPTQTLPTARETFRHISSGQRCDHLTNLTGPQPREEHSLQGKYIKR